MTIAADVDPCPHDFRDPVDGRCNEERLSFSQLDSLQVVREALPAAKLTEACPWSDAEKAAKFGLKSVECVRAVRVFRLDLAEKVLSGFIAITADVRWVRFRQKQLEKYIASVAGVTPSKLSLSLDIQVQRDRSSRFNGQLLTVIFHVVINVGHLPFRPLLCKDPNACNFMKDVTAQFIDSKSSLTFNQFCDFSCTTTVITTGNSVVSIVELTQSMSGPSNKTDRNSDEPNYSFSGQSNNKNNNGVDDGAASGWRTAFIFMTIICIGMVIAAVLFCLFKRKQKIHPKIEGMPAAEEKVNDATHNAEEAMRDTATTPMQRIKKILFMLFKRKQKINPEIEVTPDAEEKANEATNKAEEVIDDNSNTPVRRIRKRRSPPLDLAKQNQALREILKTNGIAIPDHLTPPHDNTPLTPAKTKAFARGETAAETPHTVLSTPASELMTDNTEVQTVKSDSMKTERRDRRRRRRQRRRVAGPRSKMKTHSRTRTKDRQIKISGSGSDASSDSVN